MKWKLNPNAVNQCPKGTDVYVEGEPADSMALVIKGRVQIHHEGAKFLVNSGTFLGINDLSEGSYQSTYTALDDLIIYVFTVSRREELENILSINKDYHGFLIASNNKMIYELHQIYTGLMKQIRLLYEFLAINYKDYLESATRLGYYVKTSPRIQKLSVNDIDLEPDRDKINYYRECAGLPIDVVKTFYSFGNTITLYQAEDQIGLINRLNEALKLLAKEYASIAECLMDESDTCLFGLVAAYAIEIVNADGNSSMIMETMDSIIDEINRVETFYEKYLGGGFRADRDRMEKTYHLLLTGTRGREMSAQTYLKYSMEESDRALSELTDSFGKLIGYAEIEEEASLQMQKAMQDFVNMKDRLATDENARSVRHLLTEKFYELYKAVFMRAYRDKYTPRIIDMFLQYGYADERLLDKEQLISLYFLKDGKKTEGIRVYNIREWLTMIYEGHKEPSKNEFDLEYPEELAALKKQGKLTEKEMREQLDNKERKLEYEIKNMFRYNNRTTNGQISTFVPVLHKDMVINQFDQSYVTCDRLRQSLEEIMDIDYSVFDREVLYVNKDKNIVKEYIVKKVYPDIILLPTVGCNGIMWQEITGKRRDSEGRFLFPIFCETDLMALMVRVCGRFRWEMCRTIEGTAWNDIKHKSLTSEYSDYLQFYRKMRDLSEEKKEKIKLQIQKGRNNSREVFVMDYEQWIKNESGGAIKLNKPVREIMATYCPFSRRIREQLVVQPLFEEAYARYERDKLKKIRETEGRYRMLMKDRIELTQELINTLEYYKKS